MNPRMREKLFSELLDLFTNIPDQGSDGEQPKDMGIEITAIGKPESGDDLMTDDKHSLLEKAGMKGC